MSICSVLKQAVSGSAVCLCWCACALLMSDELSFSMNFGVPTQTWPMMTQAGSLSTGIENDIKIWSPLAEKAHPPGAAAEELMSRNRSQATRESQSQGRVNQVMVTPQIIAQLMRLQGMHQRRRQPPRLPPPPPFISLKITITSTLGVCRVI